MVGIYKITNPEGKAYIGYSRKIENRWASHKNAQHKANYKLKESLIKYGGDSHQFEIIEELEDLVKDAFLRKRERYWIKKLDTFNNGLNSNGGGSGCDFHTAESKRKISEKLKGKPKPKDFGANRKKWQHTEEWKNKLKNAPRCPVIVESLDGKVVKEFGNQALAAKWIGVSRPVIQLILRKKPQSNGKIPTSTKGYKIKYK